jgi:invasion protein IalB
MTNVIARVARCGIGLSAFLALAAASGAAWAQAEGEAPAAAPAAKAPAAKAPAAKAPAKAAPGAKAAAAAGKDAKKSTQWVKLCDKIKVKTKPEKDAVPEEKTLCSTMFEAIESNTGQLIVSVGLQEIEGAPKQVLAVMVPLGVVIPGGVKLAAYNADQWAKAAKDEKIELKDLKTSDLKFAHCMPVGCTAETQATPEVLEMLKGNAGLAVLAIWANGNQFTVPVPLTGFAEAHGGKPVDKETYQANRKKLMEQIMQRQAALREKAKADQMKHLPPPPPGETGAAAPAGAPAAKAPAPK